MAEKRPVSNFKFYWLLATLFASFYLCGVILLAGVYLQITNHGNTAFYWIAFPSLILLICNTAQLASYPDIARRINTPQ